MMATKSDFISSSSRSRRSVSSCRARRRAACTTNATWSASRPSSSSRSRSMPPGSWPPARAAGRSLRRRRAAARPPPRGRRRLGRRELAAPTERLLPRRTRVFRARSPGSPCTPSATSSSSARRPRARAAAPRTSRTRARGRPPRPSTGCPGRGPPRRRRRGSRCGTPRGRAAPRPLAGRRLRLVRPLPRPRRRSRRRSRPRAGASWRTARRPTRSTAAMPTRNATAGPDEVVAGELFRQVHLPGDLRDEQDRERSERAEDAVADRALDRQEVGHHPRRVGGLRRRRPRPIPGSRRCPAGTPRRRPSERQRARLRLGHELREEEVAEQHPQP